MSYINVVSHLINTSVSSNNFTSGLKEEQVLPLCKKNDALNKENYRPVSVLPTISKLFESIIHNQLSEYFDTELVLSK